MEELPRNLLLSIPLKVPDKLEWTSSLLAYITASYAEDAEKYTKDAHTLDALREQALSHSTSSTFALEDLSIYFNQLTFLGSRFPPDINLSIGWFPIFIQQEKPDTINNINYEKSCVLYRLASIYSELGCSQNWVSTEGIRKACQHFQNAAGCLKYVKMELISELRCEPPKDFEIFNALISFMMAQAHECVWQKAVMEHMKHGTVARLATRVSDFYDTFLSDATPLIPNTWKTYADTKSNFFKAFAQYQKANEAISNGRYGEEIARLYLSKSHNACALQHLEKATLLNQAFVDQIHTLQQSIERDLSRAEKDNDVVYLETVPDPTALAPILRSDMVKPILPNFILSPSYWLTLPDRPETDLFIKRPLFEKLVPFAVHQAASVYSDKKDYIVNVEVIAKNQELKAESEKLLDELCLPYSLDIVDVLPKKLVEYAEEVQHEGGIQSLYDMLQKIQTMSRKATHLIEEGFNVIEDENEEDVQLSRQYGKLWARPSSRSLTHNLLTLGGQYNDTVQAAQKADRIVQAKVTKWGKAIAMLSRPPEEIQTYLPTLQEDEENYEFIHETLTSLRSQLEILQQETNERDELQDKVTLMAEKDDISSALVEKANELTKGSPIIKLEPEQFSSVFEEHLARYKVFEDEMKVHITKQADVLHTIQELYGQFSFIVANKNVLNKREKAITNLEAAFTKFKEIRTNLVEGIKFYSHYTDSLSQFRDECNDFALSRRLEASELARDTNPGRLLLLKK
ncbi:BRO1-like domain-containing protein [Pilaira anomala]|nr:BRO1-like domain-containing protein [Pilaira anomala]